jgi:uncharacterized protein (TIGR03437 family)
VNATGLLAGTYVGQIQILAAGASNTPQIVSVLLNVLKQGSVLPPVVQPTGLIFVRQAGTSSPGSQTVSVNTANPATASAVPSAATNAPFPMILTPTNFAFSSSQPGQFVVQPTLGSLAPGQYTTNITIQSSNPGQVPDSSCSGLNPDSTCPINQTVTVLFVVTAGATSSAQPGGAIRTQALKSPGGASGCPTKLTVTPQSLTNIFSVPVGVAQNVQARVVDDCNMLVDGATVTATFQFSDSPLTLNAQGNNGIYENSWTPLRAGVQTVTLTANGEGLTGQTVMTGTVTGQSQASATFANAASFVPNAAISPGSLISVFGTSMATSTASPSGFPIPTNLGGAQLNIGGQNVPLLYVSPTQVNAQVPLTILPNSGTQASFGSGASQGQFLVGLQNATAQTLLVAAASPGIFITNAQGQGAITNASGSILNSGNPASPGQVVIIYATGLGPVNTTPALGAAAPTSPAATTLALPTVTIGGLPATVQFSGLAPGFVGLYQINVVVPTNVAAGSAVPVILMQSGFSSNTVTIAVK